MPPRVAPKTEFDRVKIAMGMAIQLRRESQNWSRKQLGDRLGLSYRQIANWETGRDAVPVTRVPGVCRALGVSPNFLYTWNEDGPTQAEIARLSKIMLHLRYMQEVGATLAAAMAEFSEAISVGLGLAKPQRAPEVERERVLDAVED